MAIIDILNNLANAARIVPLGGAKPDVGVPLSFGLAPAFPSVLSTVQAGDVSAIWFNKDVRFADGLGVPVGTALPNYLSDSSRVFGGQLLLDPPMANLPIPGGVLTLPKILNTDPTEPQKDLATGTPGILGQLAGALPIPVEVPVSVSVTWTVKKGGVPATPGVDFVAPKGLAGLVLDMVFLVSDAKGLVADFSPLVKFEVSATVEIKALGLTTGPVEVKPPLTLDVPAILGIPTVLALFRHPNYDVKDGDEDGSVLLGVPQNSVLRNSKELASVLDALRDTLKRLQSFQKETASGLKLATFLLGLGTLIDALDGQPKFQFVVGEHGVLGLVKFSEHGWRIFPPRLGGSDHAEDKTSSVIVLGAPKQGVKLWGDGHFGEERPPKHPYWLELFVGTGMWLTIPDFRYVKKVSDMAVYPAIGTPGVGSVVELKREDPSWNEDINDKISSIDYRWLP